MTGETPRRRHSPAVYRRRRIAVLIAVLVVAGLIWLLVAQPWRGNASEGAAPQTEKTQEGAGSLPVPTAGATPAKTPTGKASTDETTGGKATPKPTPSGTPAAEPCVGSDIAVEAVTSQDAYSNDQVPSFSIRLTNEGDADCTLNVGTSGQVFTVTSGSDTWWRSTDCQSEPSDMVVLLTAGQTVSSASPLTWDRTRSAVGTCDDETRPRAPGGGASYHLAVEIGGVAATETTQFLLY
ncbi:hypothetical protein [Microbacterium flavescens]|uniref:hypothetical protein n=1 Tax=Microbacterium flavescens TaxID=69366 RepID=UPI001BDE88D4|nr:hypothetical protein [Microbacterium flavescens]BFF09330.1 hypothetical protein GCM10025699_06330 [Microbacterium flavescens]